MSPVLLESIGKSAVLVLIALVVYWLLGRTVERARTRGRMTPNGEFLTLTVTKWTLGVVLALSVVQQFGISLASVWAALSAVLVLIAVGFVALWSVLSNMLCAVLLVLFAPFRIGDRIEVIELVMNDGSKLGLRGRVTGIDLLYTSLQDDDAGGSVVRIPNNLILQRAIRTIDGTDTRSLQSELFERGSAGQSSGQRHDDASEKPGTAA